MTPLEFHNELIKYAQSIDHIKRYVYGIDNTSSKISADSIFTAGRGTLYPCMSMELTDGDIRISPTVSNSVSARYDIGFYDTRHDGETGAVDEAKTDIVIMSRMYSLAIDFTVWLSKHRSALGIVVDSATFRADNAMYMDNCIGVLVSLTISSAPICKDFSAYVPQKPYNDDTDTILL